jgi:hypothetical protein
VSGVFAVRALPYRTGLAFVTGSYLAVVGVALSLGPVGDATAVRLLGVVLFALAVVAIVGTLRTSLSGVFPELSTGGGDQ